MGVDRLRQGPSILQVDRRSSPFELQRSSGDRVGSGASEVREGEPVENKRRAEILILNRRARGAAERERSRRPASRDGIDGPVRGVGPSAVQSRSAVPRGIDLSDRVFRHSQGKDRDEQQHRGAKRAPRRGSGVASNCANRLRHEQTQAKLVDITNRWEVPAGPSQELESAC